MAWDNITGEQSILPSNAGGQDEVKFENGKAKKVRLLLPNGEEPYSYFEHCLEVETIENGQTVRTFRTIRCAKTQKNPNAYCPLCDGQQVRRRVRHACNVFDHELNKVQKLNAGTSVFEVLANTRKMGVDILGVDWGIIKTGEGRNDTKYTATNLGASPFEYNPEVHGALFNIEQEFAPHTIDDMKSIVEGAGGSWDQLTTPPELVYPTLEEALAHKMPNGSRKDMTFKQIWEADKSPRGFIAFLAMKSDRQNEEKAAAQVIYARLGGVAIPGVPMEDNELPLPVDVTPVKAETTTEPISADRQDKISKINGVFATKDKYVKGGFNTIIEEMKKCGNGKTNIQDFTDEELDTLLKAVEA
jgi:hypothetical protein